MNKNSKEKVTNLSLWYEQPASIWEEALPIGNGRLGAMIFGDPCQEHLHINEDTIWSGKPQDYAHKGAYRYLERIRELIASGAQQEAEALAMEEFMSIPLRQRSYQPFCDLHLDFVSLDADRIKDYRRDLDLEQAIANVSFQHQGVLYQREYLASKPHQAIFAHCSANQAGMINVNVQLASAHESITVDGDQCEIILSGEVEPGGISFQGRVVVHAENGVITTNNALDSITVQVRQADAVTLMFVGASSFVDYQDISGDPSARCEQYLDNLKSFVYDQVKAEHIADYQELFGRLSISMGEPLNQPTDKRIVQLNKQPDPDLLALYLQYGRYLMIAGSRSGTRALNLQGIWNDKLKPSWGSKYTCNINLEMNYWPAESTNLSECHQPLFDLIKVVSETGKVVAREHYNCRGWVLHHNTDIWGGSAPINNSNHGIWPTGGAWLCDHLWQHYLYTEDRGFLEEYYPIMRDAALFFVDYCIEDPETGWLISSPSNSPEHGGLVAGPTMDHQIIRNLLNDCIESSQILGVDQDFRKTWQEMTTRLAPNQIGQHGQLQEWLTDLDNPTNKHRHISHLWGLHPGREISPHIDPKMSKAAETTLEHRGDDGTGWCMAWKINFWTRLENGEQAYKLLVNLIGERTYPNLFNAHPPYQIDGNFGTTAGIVAFLLQDHLEYISLLPALPSVLPEGKITGLCAIGGFSIDLSWNEGVLVEAEITSKLGNECRIHYCEPIAIYDSNDKLVPATSPTHEVYAFPTEQGGKYRVVKR